MAFEFVPGPGRKALDPERGASMLVKPTPEQEWLSVFFEMPPLKIQFKILLELMPGSESLPNAKQPVNKISSAEINSQFIKNGLKNHEENTELMKYIIKMLNFVLKNKPYASSSAIWSDQYFNEGKATLPEPPMVYRMPSNDEIRGICTNDLV